MKAKALFLILFVPLHSLLTFVVVQRAFNPPAEGSSLLFKSFLVLITSPILLPLLMFDPDGDRLPRWLQMLSVPFNSLVCGLLLLLAFAVLRRYCRSHRGPA